MPVFFNKAGVDGSVNKRLKSVTVFGTSHVTHVMTSYVGGYNIFILYFSTNLIVLGPEQLIPVIDIQNWPDSDVNGWQLQEHTTK